MADTLDLGTLGGRLAMDPMGWISGLAKGESATMGFKGKALLAFAGVGAAAIGVGVALYKIGGEFDDLSDTIRATTGKSGDELDGLVDTAKRIGTEIPASFDDIGPVLSSLHQRLGLTGPLLEDMTEQFLEYGRISGESLDPKTVTAALNAFDVKGKDSSKVLDQMFRVSQKTGVSLNDLSSQVARGAPILSQYGFNIGESAQLLGNLDKAGLDGGKTTAALNKAMGVFAKEGKEPRKALEDTIEGIEGYIESGDNAAAQQLAGKLFGTRGAAQFVAAVKSGKLSVDDLTSSAYKQGDSILKAGEDTADFSEQWLMFKNRALVAVEPLATRVFNTLGEGMAWVNAVGVPALMSLGDEFDAVAVFISGAIGWLQSLSGEGDKAGGKVSQLSGTFRTAWTAIKSIFTSTISIVLSLWNAFGGAITSYLRTGLTNALTILRGVFNVIAGVFKTVAALLKGDWAGVWAGIKQILTGAVGIIKGLVSQLWNIIRTVFRLGGIALRGIFSGIWSGIKSLAAAGINGLVEVVRGIPGKIRALGGLFKSAGRSIIDMFVNGLQNAGGAIGGIAGSIWTAVKGLLNGAISKINAALEFRISIPGAPDVNINPPNIPHLAAGGYVDKATLAVIGEAGPEVVAPLSGSKGKAAMASLGSGPGNSEELAMALADLLEETRGMRDELAAVADRDIALSVDGRQAGKIYKAGERAAGRLG